MSRDDLVTHRAPWMYGGVGIVMHVSDNEKRIIVRWDRGRGVEVSHNFQELEPYRQTELKLEEK